MLVTAAYCNPTKQNWSTHWKRRSVGRKMEHVAHPDLNILVFLMRPRWPMSRALLFSTNSPWMVSFLGLQLHQDNGTFRAYWFASLPANATQPSGLRWANVAQISPFTCSGRWRESPDRKIFAMACNHTHRFQYTLKRLRAMQSNLLSIFVNTANHIDRQTFNHAHTYTY